MDVARFFSGRARACGLLVDVFAKLERSARGRESAPRSSSRPRARSELAGSRIRESDALTRVILRAGARWILPQSQTTK